MNGEKKEKMIAIRKCKKSHRQPIRVVVNHFDTIRVELLLMAFSNKILSKRSRSRSRKKNLIERKDGK